MPANAARRVPVEPSIIPSNHRKSLRCSVATVSSRRSIRSSDVTVERAICSSTATLASISPGYRPPPRSSTGMSGTFHRPMAHGEQPERRRLRKPCAASPQPEPSARRQRGQHPGATSSNRADPTSPHPPTPNHAHPSGHARAGPKQDRPGPRLARATPRYAPSPRKARYRPSDPTTRQSPLHQAAP